MSVQPAWNLDTTSTSTIQVARGLLHAATTDNVQPLCIMACEQFGNTLAVSPQTLRKIEHSVLPTPQSAVIAFIKGSVGYSKSDCVSYLGKSQAGVQFLALASALATWPDKFSTAECLHAMLIGTASDKALMPTVRQVKSLLTSIEPRCHRSGFTDEVIGWHLLLARHPALSNYAFMNEPCIPHGEGMANMVDALRQLNRIGAADITRVIIRPGVSAPWTAAFVNWSLGYPPTITVGKTSVLVLESPNSRVTVNISDVDQDDEDFSITTYSSIRGPSELVTPGCDTSAIGMISLENYGQLLLDECDVDPDTREKAFQAALPYALCKIIKLVCYDAFSGFWNTTPQDKPSQWQEHPHGGQGFVKSRSSNSELVIRQFVSPFRGFGAIHTIYRLMFKEDLYLNSIEVETDISSLPDVASTVGNCNCQKCDKNKVNDHRCKWDSFWFSLAGIVRDVLALSLYDCPDQLQVSSQAASGFIFKDQDFDKILVTIRRKQLIRLSAVSFLDRALEITGHDTHQLAKSHWAMSSVMGQATWLTLYESHSYCRGGYLSLSWHPGLLHHDGEFFNLAVFRSNSSGLGISGRSLKVPNTHIRTPCNLFSNLELDWHVSKGEDRLCVDLGVRDGPKRYFLRHSSVIDVMSAFHKAVIVRYCGHPSTTELLSSQPGLDTTGPMEPERSHSGVNVVPVDGNDVLRFLALYALGRSNTGSRIVLRDEACLNCCLKVCQEHKASIMIL
ncbi:hypothetical protein DER45DRAFT_580899 [Fusarium avenaceum]|nr:hypothetical protein DER45DRAFT_580899 [Fusarium avenaceum]